MISFTSLLFFTAHLTALPETPAIQRPFLRRLGKGNGKKVKLSL
jgi:hypothetical protein